MDFRLLGPLEVADQERALALGGVKQRSLVALLLLHANEVAVAERLIGELWGEAPPATVGKNAPTVQVRCGAAPPGPAPEDPRTRFRWSLTAAGP